MASTHNASEFEHESECHSVSKNVKFCGASKGIDMEIPIQTSIEQVKIKLLEKLRLEYPDINKHTSPSVYQLRIFQKGGDPIIPKEEDHSKKHFISFEIEVVGVEVHEIGVNCDTNFDEGMMIPLEGIVLKY